MKKTTATIFAALVGLGACSQGTNNQPQANLEEANQAAENTAEVPESKANNAISNASLPEPKGAIDPKSVEAAGQVVQHFDLVPLLEQPLGDVVPDEPCTTGNEYALELAAH